jgi:hypothetical protein
MNEKKVLIRKKTPEPSLMGLAHPTRAPKKLVWRGTVTLL